MTAHQETELITLLWGSLKRDPEFKDRRQTGWGTKTQKGLLACIQRIMVGPRTCDACMNGYHEEHVSNGCNCPCHGDTAKE